MAVGLSAALGPAAAVAVLAEKRFLKRKEIQSPTYAPVSTQMPSAEPLDNSLNATRMPIQPSSEPSSQPSTQPSAVPSSQSLSQPSSEPSSQPFAQLSGMPSRQSLSEPSSEPSSQPSAEPSAIPSSYTEPSILPTWTQNPTITSSNAPSDAPTKLFIPGEMLLVDEELGIKLSSGLEGRLIAEVGEKVEFATGKKSELKFHSRHDGAGVVNLEDRGYVYVSNSEESKTNGAGVYGIFFNLDNDIIGYENLLTNTKRNCGGGLSPWNTWISCEEFNRGHCYQVDADPMSPNYMQTQKTVLGEGRGGRFESVAFDNRIENRTTVYVTEDAKFGAMRRFESPTVGYDSLHKAGDMSYLEFVDDRHFQWTTNLTAARESANDVYPNSEGISVHDGTLYFTAKSTQKLFILDLDSLTYKLETTGLSFEGKGSFNAQPDQVMRGDRRFLYFTESGGNNPGIYVRDLYTGKYMTIFEADEDDGRYAKDETVGLAFSPDRSRMYAGYQTAGVLFELKRSDGQAFP